MRRQAYLGIDVGTTAIKALLVDEQLRVIGQAGGEYPLDCPRRGWAQQDPEDWWEGLIACVRQVLADRPPVDIAALSLSTQGDTLCPVDADGRALGPARTWLDTRAAAEMADLLRERPPEWWFRRCGMKPAPFHALGTIAWLRKHNSDAFKKAAWFALVPDFLLHRLCGERVVDVPNASRTLFFHTVKRCWDQEALSLLGIDESRVAEARESGTIVGPLLPQAAHLLGLSTDTVVVVGGHDQTAAAIGCGALTPGTMMLSCGTAWALLGAASAPVLDEQARLQTQCHAFPKGWGVLGAQPGGAVLRWFRAELAPETAVSTNSYDILVSEAEHAPQAAPVICLPHVYGAITPAWQEQARAGFLGLSLQHTRGSLVRAILEGVALECRWNVEVMEEVVGEIKELRMIGGAAKSTTWTQIVANATGKRVVVPEVTEATAYGAALLAAKAMGAISELAEGTSQLPIVKIVTPTAEEQARLTKLWEAYRSLFHTLAAHWRLLENC
ncbi:MAG: xylulokinase [Candidatus Zipacnadales bacterium]